MNIGRRIKEIVAKPSHALAHKTAELVGRAELLYSEEGTTQSDVETLPNVIYEQDLSSRTGVHRFKSAYPLLPPYEIYTGRYYKRRYVFPLPLLGKENSPYDFGSNYPQLQDTARPVSELREYIAANLRGSIAEAHASFNILELYLRQAADVEWQARRPYEFYQKLGECMTALYPEYPTCYVERVDQ